MSIETTAGGPPTSECIEWRKGKDDKGYGLAKIAGRTRRMHRVVYEKHYGPIPSGLFVLYNCDNPSCVNPKHLRLGTHQDNMDEMVAKNRQARNRGFLSVTTEQITEIKELYASGKLTSDIAAKYMIGNTTVLRIVKGVR